MDLTGTWYSSDRIAERTAERTVVEPLPIERANKTTRSHVVILETLLGPNSFTSRRLVDAASTLITRKT